jgi:hypothetical protein
VTVSSSSNTGSIYDIFIREVIWNYGGNAGERNLGNGKGGQETIILTACMMLVGYLFK